MTTLFKQQLHHIVFAFCCFMKLYVKGEENNNKKYEEDQKMEVNWMKER